MLQILLPIVCICHSRRLCGSVRWLGLDAGGSQGGSGRNKGEVSNYGI